MISSSDGLYLRSLKSMPTPADAVAIIAVMAAHNILCNVIANTALTTERIVAKGMPKS